MDLFQIRFYSNLNQSYFFSMQNYWLFESEKPQCGSMFGREDPLEINLRVETLQTFRTAPWFPKNGWGTAANIVNIDCDSWLQYFARPP